MWERRPASISIGFKHSAKHIAARHRCHNRCRSPHKRSVGAVNRARRRYRRNSPRSAQNFDHMIFTCDCPGEVARAIANSFSGDTLLISCLGPRFLRFKFSIQQLFQFFKECIISYRSTGSLMFSEQRYFRFPGIYG
jgi:hypothetical protein